MLLPARVARQASGSVECAMLWLVLSLAASASELRYYPGPGDDTVPLEDPSILTGLVLAHVEDPATLVGHPGVGTLTVLPGTGHVVSIVPGPGVSPVQLANALHGLPDVRWSHPDRRLDLVPHAVPNDPLYAEQWHLQNVGQRGFTPGVDINAEQAWDITTGDGVMIAVLDSGTDVDHPDLFVTPGSDYVTNDGNSDPDNGNNHGTAVAGVIGAIGNNGIGMTGVAWDAEVYGIRILTGDPQGGGSSDQGIYLAFVEATDAGAVVINNSWGIRDCPRYRLSGAIEDGFNYAEDEGRDGLGVLNVFSAGNEGCDIQGDGILAHPAVVGVAAVNGRDVRTGYSNFGEWVDISAPSNNIATTDLAGEDGGGTNVDGDLDYTPGFGGTSASAPQVSGVAALMIAANPRLTAAEVRRVLCETAVRIDVASALYDETGWSPLYGCGRIDAGAAVRAVVNAGPPEPPAVDEAGESEEAEVRLEWPEAIDPDGDQVRYRVRWALGDDEDEEVVNTERPWVDLTGEVGVGDVIRWRVRAIDLWGPGEWSTTQTLAIVPPPPEPESRGCDHGSSSGAWALALAGLGLLGRRRRS